MGQDTWTNVFKIGQDFLDRQCLRRTNISLSAFSFDKFFCFLINDAFHRFVLKVFMIFLKTTIWKLSNIIANFSQR